MIMKKFFFPSFIIILLFIIGSYLLSQNHSNKFTKVIKDQIPSEVKSFFKKTILFIPYTKREIKKLKIENIDNKKKIELLRAEKNFFENKLNNGKSKIENYNNKKYKFFSVVLPFVQSEVNLYSNKKSGYVELYNQHIIIFFQSGKIIFINKKDFFKGKFNYTTVKSNLNDSILFDKKIKWTGVKDIFVDGDDILISATEEIKKKCYNTSLYQSKINKTELDFKKIYRSDECFNLDRKIKAFKYFNGYQMGGRIKTSKNKIYLTVGDYNTWEKVQDKMSSAGKILEFDKDNLKKKIISLGHRNPQGLYLNKNKNIMVSTEHGPQGGDEINLIKLDQNLVQNFGWPISSYGNHYPEVPLNSFTNKIAPLHKSHKKFGFIEPIKYFKKSIGISEIIQNYHIDNSYFVTSLKNKAIYEIQLDNNHNFVEIKNEIKVNERIRDIIYDTESRCYLIFGETTPKLISMCLVD
jgi:hypothetical protein